MLVEDKSLSYTTNTRAADVQLMQRAKSHCISNHGTDLVVLEYSGPHTRRVKNLPFLIWIFLSAVSHVESA